MKDAVDYSAARPGAAVLAQLDLDALFYVGVSRPDQGYVDSLTAAGVRWTFIFETDPNRSQDGYQAGVDDAAYFHMRSAERGYPANLPAMVVVSDGNANDPNPHNSSPTAIAEYGQGWADTIARPLCGYGNRYTVNAFNAGVSRVAHARLVAPNGGWLPIPWGADPTIDAAGQDANTPSPIPGTDLNRVWIDWYTPIPPPTPGKSAYMDILHVIGGRTVLLQGNLILRDFVGNPVGPAGIPEDAIAYQGGDDDPNHIPLKIINADEMALVSAVSRKLAT